MIFVRTDSQSSRKIIKSRFSRKNPCFSQPIFYASPAPLSPFGKIFQTCRKFVKRRRIVIFVDHLHVKLQFRNKPFQLIFPIFIFGFGRNVRVAEIYCNIKSPVKKQKRMTAARRTAGMKQKRRFFAIFFKFSQLLIKHSAVIYLLHYLSSRFFRARISSLFSFISTSLSSFNSLRSNVAGTSDF